MAATGELVELLAKALRRARMGANDVGVGRRISAAGDEVLSNPSPAETLSDWWNDGTYRAGNQKGLHPDVNETGNGTGSIIGVEGGQNKVTGE